MPRGYSSNYCLWRLRRRRLQKRRTYQLNLESASLSSIVCSNVIDRSFPGISPLFVLSPPVSHWNVTSLLKYEFGIGLLKLPPTTCGQQCFNYRRGGAAALYGEGTCDTYLSLFGAHLRRGPRAMVYIFCKSLSWNKILLSRITYIDPMVPV